MIVAKRRKGFTLLDVALATVIITIGTMFVGKYFADVYDQLSPRANGSGLRRYLMAEQILKAEAEGLRVLQVIPADAGACRLVRPPASTGFTLTIGQFQPTGSPDANNIQMYLWDLGITDTSAGGRTLYKLSMSTVRYTVANTDAKVGL